MSFRATVRGWRTKRQLDRAAHAEERAFVSMYDRQGKNRPSQLLLAVAFCATLASTSLALAGSRVGLYVVVPSLLVTVATLWWCFRTWDY
jgi:Flp pilus assembly protein TadB